jgi:hypothetical protein
MKFNSQICTTKEQSERLLALGLKKETADMCINLSHESELVYSFSYSEALSLYHNYGLDRITNTDLLLPAWSLHRLLCLLPREYTYDIDFQQIMQDFVFGSQDMYDEMVSCIETLIEAGYLYEEYLEE